MNKKIIVFSVAALLLALVAVPAGAAEKITIISPHWEGIREEFTRDFKAWYKSTEKKDVEIIWIDQGGASNCLQFIKSEFARSPKGIDIDLFYGGGISPFVELAGDGLLTPYKAPPDVLKRIPAKLKGVPLYDEKYQWYGASLAGFGILYNKRLQKMLKLPPVREWADLANPALAGWVGAGDPRHSGSMHAIYEIILQAYGWDKGWRIIRGIGANANAFTRSSGQAPKDLAAGETAFAMLIDTYAYSAIEEAGEKNLGFVFPSKVTAITPDPIAMLKGAPNPAAARAFIRYTLSPRAQRIWMYRAGVKGGPKKFSLNKMSVLPEVYKGVKGKTVIETNPFKDTRGFSYDFKKDSARWSVLNDLIGAFVIDTHADLAKAWKRVAKRKNPAAALGAFPVSEKETMSLAAKWDNAEFRNAKIASWLKTAGEKYKKVK